MLGSRKTPLKRHRDEAEKPFWISFSDLMTALMVLFLVAMAVALLSVTEGDDKPLKYPVMFREADCVLITKIDLLPYLPVEVERIEDHIHQVNPRCSVIRLSASSGVGLDRWHAWLRETHAAQCPNPVLTTAKPQPSHPTLVNA